MAWQLGGEAVLGESLEGTGRGERVDGLLNDLSCEWVAGPWILDPESLVAAAG